MDLARLRTLSEEYGPFDPDHYTWYLNEGDTEKVTALVELANAVPDLLSQLERTQQTLKEVQGIHGVDLTAAFKAALENAWKNRTVNLSVGENHGQVVGVRLERL